MTYGYVLNKRLKRSQEQTRDDVCKLNCLPLGECSDVSVRQVLGSPSPCSMTLWGKVRHQKFP